jgi:hypothetical protein
VSVFSTVAAGVASALEQAALLGDRDSCGPLLERLDSLCDLLLDQTETLAFESLSL